MALTGGGLSVNGEHIPSEGCMKNVDLTLVKKVVQSVVL